ncbi:MAG: hypothetical protein H8E33_01465, partial [Candidatus Cloacimonetes bacterium]|nr:hypothetical protein [Candidatus Cloacimonadota bacterium]
MKKFIVLLIISTFVFGLFANEIMQPAKTKIPIRQLANEKVPVRKITRDVPAYQFVVDPIDLTTTYYDYMPGSYNSLPVRVQPDVSEPYYYPAGGVYMIYHGQETSVANRREYYAYINASGNLTGNATIAGSDIWEGYGGIDIDPVTADPFCTWHQSAGANWDCLFTYDLFHLMGGPGLWKDPYHVIEFTDHDPDEFIWPYTYVGNSPTAGYNRVFVTGNNATSSTGGSDLPSENVLLGYADFSSAELDAQLDLNWTYQQFDYFDDMHAEDPEWARAMKAMAVNGDVVAYMGYSVYDTGGDELFVLWSEDCGVTWEEPVTLNCQYPVDNPLDMFGDPTFVAEDGTPYDMYFGFVNSGHQNAIFDADGNLHMTGAMGLQTYPDAAGDSFYYPYIIFPKHITFDFATKTFHYHNLEAPIHEDFAQDQTYFAEDEMYLPWDTNNDGAVDEFVEDSESEYYGDILFYSGWPIYFYDNDTAFHENVFKIVGNEDMGWLVAVWHDGLYNKYANDGDEDYADWMEYSQMAFSVSSDNGATWSDVLYIDANPNSDNYASELNGMLPCYVYPGDKVEYVDDTHGKVHLMFLDDNSFGSSIHGFGAADGGTMEYAAIEIEFPESGGWTGTYGDVNGDDNVSAYDAALVLQYSAGIISDWTDDQLTAGDVNGDDNVSAYDAALILQYSAGIITEFPVEGGKGGSRSLDEAMIYVYSEGNTITIAEDESYALTESDGAISFQFVLYCDNANYTGFTLGDLASGGMVAANP